MKMLSEEWLLLMWGASVCIVIALCEVFVSNITCVTVTLSSNAFVF
jgi:hypothetical protein